MGRGRRVLAVLLWGGWGVIGTGGSLEAQTASAAPPPTSCGADLIKSLAGTWTAPQYKMKRGSEVGAQVFGPNSYDLRDVSLTLDASGNGALKVETSVLDEKGKEWAPTVIDAKISIAASEPTQAGRCEPPVTVAGAEERYLDETKYQAGMTGARVMVILDPATKQIDLRFEPPGGQGAFWTPLRRQPVR